MSQAFIKEIEESGLLHQIKTTIPALVDYVKSESAYAPIFVKQINKVNGIDVILMSNGLSYFINNDDNWEMMI